jgi:hypothetical protein
MKMSVLVLWVVTSCGLAGIYQWFGETYCLNCQGLKPFSTDDGGSMFVQDVDIYLQAHMVPQPRRPKLTLIIPYFQTHGFCSGKGLQPDTIM